MNKNIFLFLCFLVSFNSLIIAYENITSLNIYYIDWDITTNLPFRIKDIRQKNLIKVNDTKEIINIMRLLDSEDRDLFYYDDRRTPAFKRSHDHCVVIDIYHDSDILNTYAFTRFYFYNLKDYNFYINNLKKEITQIITSNIDNEKYELFDSNETEPVPIEQIFSP